MSDLTQRVRAKYPGVYDDLSDADLEKAVLAKHPEYADLAAKSEPAAEAPRQSMTDAVLSDNAALPWDARAGQAVARFAKGHPVATGATIGGALASGGTSLLGQLGLAALGAAGGAGYGLLGKGATTGDYGTPSDNAKAMATEAALSAGGEGVGKGVAKIVGIAAPRVYRGILRPSNSLQRDFEGLAKNAYEAGIPVSEHGASVANQRIGDLSQQVSAELAAKDAKRPAVRGLLPPAQGVALGTPPIHPTVPDLRDPRSAGVLLRDAAEQPYTGTAAHGNMINPREIAQRGLAQPRAEMADRALAGDADAELSALEQRFVNQRGQPLTLQDAQRLKQAEQGLADAAYKAEAMGHPVNSVDAQFHRGIARGTREAIEQRAPAVGPLNAQTQNLIGIRNAIENANMRNVGIGVKGLVGDAMPDLISRGAIAAGKGAPAAPTLLRSLMAALGYQEQ